MLRRAVLPAAVVFAAAAGPSARSAPAATPPQSTPLRVVAVIDGTGDPDGAQLAGRIGAAIRSEDGLAALADAPVVRALVAPLLDEDVAIVADARAALDQANDALAGFSYASAGSAAAVGETRLLAAGPRANVVELLANLVFTEGMARFPNDPDGTRLAFAEVHRLDPGRALDPAHFVPEVIEAYESSVRGDPGTGLVDVQVDGPAADLWVDGVKSGAAPSQVAVPAGVHFVQVTGPDAVTTGARVRVTAGGNTTLHLTVPRADATTRIARLRRILLEAPDDAARATAIAEIAHAVGTDAAIVVVRDGHGLATRVWRNEPPGLEPTVSYATDDPRGVLEPLRPPAPPPPVDRGTALGPIQLPPPPPPGPAWWKKKWVHEVALVGSLVLIGGIVTLEATRDPGASTFDYGMWK